MDTIWNQNKLINLMDSFYRLVNIRISFFDHKYNFILSYPVPLSEYCGIIRSHKSGDDACSRCDENAFRQAEKRKNPYIYQCHAGLTEIVEPIITPEKKIMGYIMIGQIRQSENKNDNIWKNIEDKAVFPINNDLKLAYKKLPILSIDQIQACATLLQALSTNIWYDNYYRIQNEPLSGKVNNYILQNLNKNLSLNAIAHELKVGKTTLCKSVGHDFQQTVNELIRSHRIKKAKHLLQTTEQTIYSIAENIGIPDYNYFTKVFKAETGVTPSVFRKLCKKDL